MKNLYKINLPIIKRSIPPVAKRFVSSSIARHSTLKKRVTFYYLLKINTKEASLSFVLNFIKLKK